jgi:hypothetical protein
MCVCLIGNGFATTAAEPSNGYATRLSPLHFRGGKHRWSSGFINVSRESRYIAANMIKWSVRWSRRCCRSSSQMGKSVSRVVDICYDMQKTVNLKLFFFSRIDFLCVLSLAGYVSIMIQPSEIGWKFCSVSKFTSSRLLHVDAWKQTQSFVCNLLVL